MATTDTSFKSSCPTTESPADCHNLTINNITDQGSSKGWDAVFKDPFVAFLVFFQILLCLIIYVGNTITISAMSFAKKLKNNMQNKYIYSLALADQLTGFNLLQLLLKNYFLEEGLWLSCQPHLVLLYTANAVSLMTMLSIAVDRYFYIVHPFVHMRHVTSRRITILILVQWALAILYGSVPIYVFNADESKGCNPFFILHRRFVAFSQPIFFFIDCLGIGVTYGLIAKVARQHYNKKTERTQQINAAIANYTTNRSKSVGSGSTAAKREQNVVSGDVPMFGHTERKFVQDVDVISAGVAVSSKTKEENTNEVFYRSLDGDRSNQAKENDINIDKSDTEMAYIIHDVAFENVITLINVAENKCPVPNFNVKAINSAVKRNKVVISQTDNTVVSTVNKQADQCGTFQCDTRSDNRQSLDGKNLIFMQDNAIITSRTPINEAECNRSNKRITASNDGIHRKSYYDSNGNTVTEISYKSAQGKMCIDRVDNSSIENNFNTVEGEINLDISTQKTENTEKEANVDASNSALNVDNDSRQDEANIYTGNNTLRVSNNSTQSVTNNDSGSDTLTLNNDKLQRDTYLHADINPQLVNCSNIENDSSFDKNNNNAIEIMSNNAPVISVVGNDIQVRDELPQSLPQANPWSLASLRWMKQMIVVFGLFVLCWTPSMVCILISAVQEPDHNVVYVLGMFGIANSAVNVFVYSICNKAYSEAIKNMCRHCRRK